MAEDPDKKILEWCGHLAVPRLVDEKSSNTCKGCSAKFGGFLSSVKSHHCRLCGELYCGACTAKYHVPLIFRIKNKDGPTRVCMACVDGCLAEKAKAEQPEQQQSTGGALASKHVSASLASLARVVEIAPPEVWEEESSFTSCPKCSAKKCKTHNCRVCGLLFCHECTSKMDIPAYFEKKKGKTGPSRVCDSCRFKIVSGAKFVERSATVTRNAFKAPPVAARRASTFAAKCIEPGCLAQSASKEGKCTVHSAPKPEAPTVIEAVVKREGTGEVVATLVIPNGEMPLSTIDVLLKKTAPQTESYTWVFRGEPIPESFFPVFLARHLGTTLMIRPKRKATVVEEPRYGSLDGGVYAADNPFKSDPELAAKRAAAKAEKETRKQKREKTAVFKRPTASRTKQNEIRPVAPVTNRKAAPQPKTDAPVVVSKRASLPSSAAAVAAGSAASALASGASIEEICRERAKKIFGQI